VEERKPVTDVQARLPSPEPGGKGSYWDLGGRTAGGAILQISWIEFTHNPLNRIVIINRDPI
jgi:hypothetical protein